MEEYTRFAESIGHYLAEALCQNRDLLETREFTAFLAAWCSLQAQLEELQRLTTAGSGASLPPS